MANNVQFLHTQRLDAIRLPGKSCGKSTGYTKGRPEAALSTKLRETGGMSSKLGPTEPVEDPVQPRWLWCSESTLHLRECSRRKPDQEEHRKNLIPGIVRTILTDPDKDKLILELQSSCRQPVHSPQRRCKEDNLVTREHRRICTVRIEKCKVRHCAVFSTRRCLFQCGNATFAKASRSRDLVHKYVGLNRERVDLLTIPKYIKKALKKGYVSVRDTRCSGRRSWR